jgi:hypothetical protein
MTLRWSLATSSYSSSCLRMSKLRCSTLRCADSSERVTMRVLDRLALGHLQADHDRVQALAGEDLHQRIFERQVEAARTRVALAAGAAAQLVVDAARLVALGADDVQAAGGDHLVVHLLPFLAQRGDPRPCRHRTAASSSRERDRLLDVAAEHDVGAAAGHVGGDGDHARPSGLGDDLAPRARAAWR